MRVFRRPPQEVDGQGHEWVLANIGLTTFGAPGSEPGTLEFWKKPGQEDSGLPWIVCSILLLSSILLYEYPTVYLSILCE